MKTMRKILSLILAVLCVASMFAGCSELPEEGDYINSDFSKKIVIDVMTFDTGDADPNSQNDRVKKYIEEKFNVQFNVSTVTYGTTYLEKLQIVLAGGEYPDLFKCMWADNVKSYYEDGLLVNLDKVADGNKLTNLKAYLDKARSYQNLTAYDGEFYAAPMEIGVYQHALYYRKDWLEKLNLEVPKTMDEFYEVAKAFKDADLDGNKTYGFSADSSWWLNHFHCMYTNSWDYKLMEDGTIQHYRALDEMRESYAFWAKMYKEGILDQSICTGTNARELFCSGRTGMMMRDCYAKDIQYIMDQTKAINPEAEIGVMLLPAGPLGSHQITGTPYLDYTAISTTAEDPARIAAILDYILSDEGQNLLRNGIEGVHYTKNEDGTITKHPEEYEKDRFGTGDYGVHWMMSLVYSDPYYVADDYQYMDFYQEVSGQLKDLTGTDYFVSAFAPLDGYSSDVTKRYLAKFNELYNQFDQKFIMGELEVNDENWQLWKDTIESEAHYSELVADWTKAYQEYLKANGG